jgi:hypothetical protein
MKLTTLTKVTIDGVMLGDGAASTTLTDPGWPGTTIPVCRPAGRPRYAE